MSSSAQLLSLVADALDKFDDAPLPASVRRALRVAQLSGDTSVATRLLMELDYQQGGERLESLADPIHLEYRDNRALGKAGSLFGFPDVVEHDTTPLEALVGDTAPSSIQLSSATQTERRNLALVREHMAAGVRAFTFDYLSRRESELRLTSAAKRIFDDHRNRTEQFLTGAAPDVLEKLNAAIERAFDDDDAEQRSQALLSCRRVLVAIADGVFPAQAEPRIGKDGKPHEVGANNYRNRLWAALEDAGVGDTLTESVGATLTDLAARIDALDPLTHKGVHEAASARELSHAVIQTYLIAGEILELVS